MMSSTTIQWIKGPLLLLFVFGFASMPCLALREANADGLANMTATCSGCHGAQGIATNPQFPNLAGQQRNYLATQIRAFRDGKRIEPTMQAIVAKLTDKKINQLATHYSQLPPKSGGTEPVNKEGKNVRALCVSCHSMDGNSVTSEWPNLAGQNAAYLQRTLLDMQSGIRQSPVMSVILEQLNEQQIKDVAEYYSQQ